MSSPSARSGWPEPRIRALQVEELYLHAPAAAACSYFGALITLGVMALFFCFTIVYFSGRLNRHMERAFRLQVERDDLVSLTTILNEKLGRENKELTFKLAVKDQALDRTRSTAS